MANMFKNQLKTKIPKNLSECVEIDKTAKELFETAASIEQQAKISAGIIAATGIIASVLFLAENYKTDGANVFYIGILITAIISYIIYYLQHFYALQMCAFATIVNNTTTTANLQMYSFQKIINEKIVLPKQENFWICPECGRKNKEKVDICNCGYNRKIDDNSETENLNGKIRCSCCNKIISSYPCKYCGWTNDTIDENDVWVCPECCRENQNEITECTCGYKK